jgi:hypothetical protein
MQQQQQQHYVPHAHHDRQCYNCQEMGHMSMNCVNPRVFRIGRDARPQQQQLQQQPPPMRGPPPLQFRQRTYSRSPSPFKQRRTRSRSRTSSSLRRRTASSSSSLSLSSVTDDDEKVAAVAAAAAREEFTNLNQFFILRADYTCVKIVFLTLALVKPFEFKN